MKKVIKCGEFFSSVDENVQKNVAVVIDGNKIVEIAPVASVNCDGCEVIDLSDKFVMPGLIDSHMHVNLNGQADVMSLFIKQTIGDLTIESMKNAQTNLNVGFTTIRDEGAFGYSDIAVRDAINAGKIVGPRMMVSGVAIGTTGGHCDSHLSPYITGSHSLGTIVDSPDAARAAVRKNFKYGADQVKVMATGGVLSFGDDPNASEFTFEEMKAILDIANMKGRISSAHAHGAEGIKIAVKAGITSIEHGMLMDDECIELMAEHGTYLVPTIIAAATIVENGVAAGMAQWAVDKAALVLANHKENLRKCREAGIKICFGTDAGTSFNYHGKQTREFELMVEYGFTPAQVLIAATKTNATMMRWNDRIGTLEVGKLADVVAFDKSPLEDIKVMNDVSFIMKDGVVYKN